MRKITLILLALILTISVYAGGKQESGEAGAKSAEPVTMEFAAWWFTEAGRVDWLNQKCDEFEQMNPGIKVDRVAIASTDVHDKFMTQAAAGTGPDVIWMRETSLHPFMKLGFLEPTGNWIDDSKYDLEPINELAVLNGERLAYNLFAYAYSLVIYNKTMFQQKGVAVPTTPQETLDAAVKLTDAPNVFGWGMPVDPSNVEYFAQAMQKFTSFFGAAIADDGEITVNSPDFVEGITWYKKFFDADVTPKSIGWRVQRKMQAEDKVAMVTDGAYHFGVMEGVKEGSSKDKDAIKPPFPSDYVLYGSNYIAMNKASDEKEAAATFLKWWLSDEFQTEFCKYGNHVGAVKVEFSDEYMKDHWYLDAYNDPSLKPMLALVEGHEEKSMEIRTTLVDYGAEILYKDAPVKGTLDRAQKAIENLIK